MTFLEALSRLMACAVSVHDVADEIGLEPVELRRARLDPSDASYLPAPPNWREALASLARKRGDALQAFADELEGETLRMTMREEPIICTVCGREIEFEQVEILAPDGKPRHKGGCPSGGPLDDSPAPTPWSKDETTEG
jgi:hypothetical protein